MTLNLIGFTVTIEKRAIPIEKALHHENIKQEMQKRKNDLEVFRRFM